MQFHLAPAAAAAMLLLSASASVFAADDIAQDDVCTGSKPFREVAQDETRSMAELCRMQEEFLRGDRGWQDTPAYARRHGELPAGWAQRLFHERSRDLGDLGAVFDNQNGAQLGHSWSQCRRPGRLGQWSTMAAP